MAEWKKIVVSGSAISQLNNDSNYLVVTDTIDSASVAARATTLSPLATASIADTATTASHTAGTASIANFATTASHALNVPDTASHALTAVSSSFATQAGTSRLADSASVAARATTLSAEATASIADRATTASFADLAGNIRGGLTASHADRATSASISDLASTLSSTATASFADSATTASQTAGTASFADLASSARAADSASVAARATTLSAAATASFADVAGTVHDGNITAAKLASDAVTTVKILDSNVTNAKLQNDSVTLGTTEVDLGATATTLQGLDLISATTGTFVLQVFESSSTVITSGSNIFGNDQADIQQITGSLKQSGSFTLSGSLKQSNGTISGSFEGDGSQLTGLATTLTVDGDSGTQNVSLTDDDLQIIGTANEVETAVTKVGNDVKVTLGLPNTVAVTASVATRANSLAPTVTASQADSATTASHAVTAVSASAILAGASFPTTQGLEGQALILNASKDFIFGDGFGTGSTKKLNQTSAAATWSFTHNLNEVYPIVQVYDTGGDQLIPERIESVDANNIKLYFATNTAGIAAAMVGGMGVSASHATQADSASVATRANGLAPTVTASFADLASDARTATSASIAALASTLSSTATASIANTATSASHTFGTASIANTATTASHTAGTASIANFATSASHAASGDGLFSGSFSGSFQGDGSDLTGLATTLTVDGDSGTEDVSLTADDLQILGTANEIVTTVTKTGNDVKATISLPDDVTIGQDLTITRDVIVSRNLTVQGTASFQATTDLDVADRFIRMASGSNAAGDGGIAVIQSGSKNAEAFAYDSATTRWGITGSFDAATNTIAPDAFMATVVEGAGGALATATIAKYTKKGNMFVSSSGDIYIYS